MYSKLPMYLRVLMKFLIVLGAINYLTISTYNINIFSYISSNPIFLRMLGIFIGVSGLFYLFNRDYYLPFLGEAVIPIKEGNGLDNKNLIKIEINSLPPNRKVLYWASNPNDNIFDNPFDAYNKFPNSGITTTNENGTAICPIVCPSSYKVYNKTLKQHIHYRYEIQDGLYSRVFTQQVKC